MHSHHPSKISAETLKTVVSRYPATAPAALKQLDTLRYETIPSSIAARKSPGETSLTKTEVEKLVEWKLKHGTFRPKLLSLVQSNPEATLAATTRSAFAALDATEPTDPLPALKILTQLKGIGPATASLLLSVYAPDQVPFFGDEAFRWVVWDEAGKPAGWKRVIKYNVKEYGVLVDGMRRVRERTGVGAMEIEKAAWVLGREGLDVGEEEGEGGEVEAGMVEEKGEKNVVGNAKGESKDEVPLKKSTKRKADDGKPPVEGVRRSSRRKTELR